ncbi:exonuclease V, chloroplastic isoform X2 [Mangifera indica]|uniref:exonuclease V, chloroplastic isoform X2 n=1 Tax=Mangifera indica TaxID=29780 RepID=UPI001CFC057C|nr:exonuclease V, chloroplastic isoform X2 [Mangifera indica]
MSESHGPSASNINNIIVPEISVEFVSDEEMAIIDAALAATRCSLTSSKISSICSPSQLQRNARSLRSITLLSKRRFSGCSAPDIEDSGDLGLSKKRNEVPESFLERFRKARSLSVTDITGTEWCEKQMEFTLLYCRKRVSKAMRAGEARHKKLVEEVSTEVKILGRSVEEVWAIKLINFITGANQLLSEGLTRELPLYGFIEGVWMVGVIDEIRMPIKETHGSPILVDTKTRVRETLPSESQRRNRRLQLMCYKCMWDNLAAGGFPPRQFFNYFSLNPDHVLSEEIRKSSTDAGYPAKTLEDIVTFYMNTWNMLQPTHDQLLLRYEFQKDESLVVEEKFSYDQNWLKSQIQNCLEFWKGEREANYTPVEERWKCQFCQFARMCSGNP